MSSLPLAAAGRDHEQVFHSQKGKLLRACLSHLENITFPPGNASVSACRVFRRTSRDKFYYCWILCSMPFDHANRVLTVGARSDHSTNSPSLVVGCEKRQSWELVSSLSNPSPSSFQFLGRFQQGPLRRFSALFVQKEPRFCRPEGGRRETKVDHPGWFSVSHCKMPKSKKEWGRNGRKVNGPNSAKNFLLNPQTHKSPILPRK